MIVRVIVTLKPGVLDPAGKAMARALRSLGFTEVGSVRAGKYIELNLDETDPERARTRAEEMCRTLLSHPTVESYRVELS